MSNNLTVGDFIKQNDIYGIQNPNIGLNWL